MLLQIISWIGDGWLLLGSDDKTCKKKSLNGVIFDANSPIFKSEIRNKWKEMSVEKMRACFGILLALARIKMSWRGRSIETIIHILSSAKSIIFCFVWEIKCHKLKEESGSYFLLYWTRCACYFLSHMFIMRCCRDLKIFLVASK